MNTKKFINGSIVRWKVGEGSNRFGPYDRCDLGWIVEKDGRQQVKIAGRESEEQKYREIGDDVEFVADGRTHVIG
jgi:hypothetical protein